ncbi:cytochrome P450 82A2 [Lepidopterella palustris CBS 459.81]|uniref:Cytochrome P450 82A2 n=1 Tax=Lepidopterella palustris CBS 459.81 TaxID=1314670 RepID=A0A8E2JI82_9PEZI|nr:cytochrome P450 82A2 [Lepidopterella palustris CBS 459.81]
MELPKTFCLAEQGSSRSVDLHIAAVQELQSLRQVIANVFGVLLAEEISFSSERGLLKSLQAIRDASGTIQLAITKREIREPDEPRTLPFIGNYHEIYPDHIGNHQRLFDRYGPVIKTVSRFVLREGRFFTKTTTDTQHPLYYMSDNTALFTCDLAAPVFEVAHKFIPPSMSPKAVQHYTPLMQQAVERCFPVFDELDKQDLAFNCYQYMFKLAGQIIYKVVLGMDLDHFASINSPPTEIIRLLGEYLVLMKKLSVRGWWYSWLPFGPAKRLAWVKERLWFLVAKAIEERPRDVEGYSSLPLDAAALRATCVADYLCRAADGKGEKLSPEFMLSNCVVLVGAGFTTSASMLSWLTYALVKHPSQQESVLQELVDFGASSDTKWTYDTLQSLSFLDKFVKEVLRMYGPSFQTARNAKEDVVLPGGYLLPKGSVIISTFPAINRNPAYWENPDRFDPARCDTEAVKNRHPFAYTPFAAGTRGCVGYNVAFQQTKIALVKFVYRYHLEDASKEPMEYDPEFLVTRPLNLYIRAVRRPRHGVEA